VQEHGDVDYIPSSSRLCQIVDIREDIAGDEVGRAEAVAVFEQGVACSFEGWEHVCAIETGQRYAIVGKRANVLSKTCAEIEQFGFWFCGRFESSEDARVVWVAQKSLFDEPEFPNARPREDFPGFLSLRLQSAIDTYTADNDDVDTGDLRRDRCVGSHCLMQCRSTLEAASETKGGACVQTLQCTMATLWNGPYDHGADASIFLCQPTS